ADNVGPGAGQEAAGKEQPGKAPSGPAKEQPGPAVLDDPNVLTVSQKPEDGGRFRTINAALEQAKPGTTIRVLDAKTDPEVLSLTQASRHAGITLEAPHRATLAPGKTPIGLDIVSVAGVTVRGFHLQPGPDTGCLIAVRDQSPGVVLEDLQF